MDGTDGTPKKGDWRERFLEALADRGSVAAACRIAKVGRTTAYRHKKQYPKFRARWREAEVEGVEMLEATAWKRAKKESDVLLIFLLKAHKPRRYREKVNAEPPVTASKAIKSAKAARNRRLADRPGGSGVAH